MRHSQPGFLQKRWVYKTIQFFKKEKCLEVIFVLVAASLTLAIGFLIAFIVSVKKGQFDDQETPAIRMLFDDNIKTKEK